MALTHRVAAGIALVMVLIAVAILPPRSCATVDNWDIAAAALCSGTYYPRARQHRQAVNRARDVLTRRLRELELADSLRALADGGHGVRSADGSVVVLSSASISADSARRWLALALGERDRIATGPPHARIIVALESSRRQAARGRSMAARQIYITDPMARRFTTVSGHDTTCVVTLRLSQANRYDRELIAADDRGTYGAFLGSCGLVGRFGAAGPTALRATRRAFFRERSAYALQRSTMVPEPSDGRQGFDPGYFPLVGCLKGETVACRSLVGLGPDALALTGYARGLDVRLDFLNYLLEVEGPEKFGRFWQSPLGGEQALVDAFGRPAAETVRAWARHDYSLPGDGQADVGAMALAALGWLGAALAAAIAVGKYRQAGA